MASCWATAETRGLSIALAALARIAETWDKEEEAGGPTGQADPADGPLPLGGVTSETLAKHLLDFLAAVGPHCSYAVADVEREEAGPLREGACPASQRTTSDAAAAAAWAFASRSRPRAPWLDTVGMRAYYFVLQGPCFSACSCMAAGELVRIGKKLCEVLGNAAQCSRGYIGPEIFSLHVYGLGALCLLLHKSVMAPEVTSPSQDPPLPLPTPLRLPPARLSLPSPLSPPYHADQAPRSVPSAPSGCLLPRR